MASPDCGCARVAEPKSTPLLRNWCLIQATRNHSARPAIRPMAAITSKAAVPMMKAPARAKAATIAAMILVSGLTGGGLM